ncbi:hypothetical protein BGZ83_008341 [Gryganskiella cystojenkinii]|nr:hypothetical protein BGZ83_008341 [Gryganskiella cystojenkinii]
MSNFDSDDDMPQLSAATMALLQQHLQEQTDAQERFEKLRQLAEDDFDAANSEDTTVADKKITMEYFTEDWQMSQFWYDDETAEKLASEIFEQTTDDQIVCCISSPTAYVAAMLNDKAKARKQNMYLFEFDTRFDVYGRQFIHYDYNHPKQFRLSDDLAGKVDMIVVDPPFLSEECLTKTMETVRHLLKPKTGKVVLCTGLVMAKVASESRSDLKITDFHPGHRNGLSNDFRCYANYDSKRWSRQ